MKKILTLFLIALSFSCKHVIEEPEPVTDYPPEIADILVNKCATEGCHNSISRFTAGGLDYSDWDVMFDGGRNGTSVIPYSTDYSFMLYTVNTDTLKGPVLIPTMPYQRPPLSASEYQTLVDWIGNGAPNKDGFVKFSDDPDRKKLYVCMQGCDQVAVVDAKTKVIMRYISVGADPGSIEAPHQVRVSPDGQYWYVVFWAGSVLQKFRTSDDALIATLDITSGNWNTIIISPDSKIGFVNGTGTNTTMVVDLETMTIHGFPISLNFPHGGFVTPDGHYLYITCQNGNFMHKFDLLIDTTYSDGNKITLTPGQPPSTSPAPQYALDPHEAMLSPDGTKYFVSCQRSNEVRVFNLANDSLLMIIPVGLKPQEFDLSHNLPYLFVTCTEDPINATQRGNVYVIDYNTLTLVGSPIYTGYQPHGIAVDDEEGLVYVANLNYDPNAPAPHHVTECGGRNGYLTIIKLNTLQLYYKTLSDGNSFQYKNEVLAFPYYVSLRK